MAADPAPEAAASGFLARLLRVLEALLTAAADTARNEARRDLRRLLVGIILLAAGVFLALTALALLSVALVFVVHATWHTGWPTAILSVAGANVVLGAGIAIAGRQRLAAPVLCETRAMLRRTATILVGD